MIVTSCATKMKQQELETIKTIGIINKFPDYPNFVTIGTTVFTNEYAEIKDSQFKQYLSSSAKRYLIAKGFQVSLINDNEKSSYDMVVELLPRDMYEMPGTFGFGLNQRYIFGFAQKPIVYVALNIVPSIKGKIKCSACYLQKFTQVAIGELPQQWSELSDQNKQIVTQSLKHNIEIAISEIFIEAGL